MLVVDAQRMELARRVSRRRDLRFEELYAAHGAEALRVAYLLTGDRALAEDLAQEAFVRVLGRFGDLRRGAFRSYLLKTVVNLTRSHFRRRKTERAYLASNRHPADQAAMPEADEELRVRLLALPERQRAAVVLRYCEDVSEQETADLLGTSPKAVRSLVGRALATLRKEDWS